MGQQRADCFAMLVWVDNRCRENACNFFSRLSIKGRVDIGKERGEQDTSGLALVIGWVCCKHVHVLRKGFAQ